MSDPDLYIGLISGTSADGIDAALVRIDGPIVEHLHGQTVALDEALKTMLDSALEAPSLLTAELAGQLNTMLGEAFAQAALLLLESAGVPAGDIRAIGSHGQTLFHAPDNMHPYTLQVGDGALIAGRTGITTINDFRSADVANGGQGAPLAPLLHEQVMSDPKIARVALNLGGIANVTVLTPGSNTLGFDTGPANTLMDQWSAICGFGSFDRDGRIAARGNVDETLLASMLSDTYFSRAAPKSTGRELFNRAWLFGHIGGDRDGFASMPDQRRADIMATLAELTAVTIANALKATDTKPDELVACGGGAHNPVLMQRIAAHLPETRIVSSAQLGIDPDFVEAVLFAWLAAERIAGRYVDTRHITGAKRQVMAGCIHEPPKDE